MVHEHFRCVFMGFMATPHQPLTAGGGEWLGSLSFDLPGTEGFASFWSRRRIFGEILIA